MPTIDKLKQRLRRRLSTRLVRWITPELVESLLTRPRVYGPGERLHLAPTAVVNDALFNLSSGEIWVGEWAMLGHGVLVLTGTHDISRFGHQRQTSAPATGHDVVVGEGAWLASNVTVLGPCRIGAHAVVAAGSVVRHDVAPFTVVAGVPAQVVAQIPHGERSEHPAPENEADAGGGV